nr:MAG TPA: hypothetical protein [Caudoviricetes sp.]
MKKYQNPSSRENNKNNDDVLLRIKISPSLQSVFK